MTKRCSCVLATVPRPRADPRPRLEGRYAPHKLLLRLAPLLLRLLQCLRSKRSVIPTCCCQRVRRPAARGRRRQWRTRLLKHALHEAPRLLGGRRAAPCSTARPRHVRRLPRERAQASVTRRRRRLHAATAVTQAGAAARAQLSACTHCSDEFSTVLLQRASHSVDITMRKRPGGPVLSSRFASSLTAPLQGFGCKVAACARPQLLPSAGQ